MSQFYYQFVNKQTYFCCHKTILHLFLFAENIHGRVNNKASPKSSCLWMTVVDMGVCQSLL